MRAIADIKEQLASGCAPGDQGYYLPEVQSIVRTPGNERRVTAGDLSGARGNKEPKSSNGVFRPCAMDCGMPAALRDVYCEDCRSTVGYH